MVGDFYGTGDEIQAGFGPIGITEKKNYADYEHNLEAVFFMFSLAKKIKIKNKILIWNFTITLSLALTK